MFGTSLNTGKVLKATEWAGEVDAKLKLGWVTALRDVLARHWLCQWLLGVKSYGHQNPFPARALLLAALVTCDVKSYRSSWKGRAGVGSCRGVLISIWKPTQALGDFLDSVPGSCSESGLYLGHALMVFTGSSLHPSDMM